jgi:hypothetical protein
MLNSILKLDGARELGKEEKQKISGGFPGYCYEGGTCNSTNGAGLVACFSGPDGMLACENGVWTFFSQG